MNDDLYQDFRRAAQLPDKKIDLGRAALTLGLSDDPNLDLLKYLSRMDQLAGTVAERIDGPLPVDRSIAALNQVLFQEHGFHGNRENYFDPKNSFLNELLDRKKGIPITLSVLYVEVAQRFGLMLQGVGFPGHFLVKYSDGDGEIVLDPFNRGASHSTSSLEKLLHQLYGRRVPLRSDFLAAATKKQILRRMLTNLKMIYLRQNQFLKALSTVEHLLILNPESPEELRDRAILYLKLECFRQALDDFEKYLDLAPEAEDAPRVREQVIRLAKQVAHIH